MTHHAIPARRALDLYYRDIVLEFVVEGAAGAQGSKRHIGRGVVIEQNKRVKPWRKAVKAAADEAMGGRDPWDCPVSVAGTFYFQRPASHFNRSGGLTPSGRRFPHPYHRGDIDKLLRSTFDALTGIVIADDKLIIDVVTFKRWGDRDAGVLTIACVE